jgi:DNA-binding transcriptional LysR family regulator
MELRQLDYFVAVAEELSFTRAATRLRVAQPAVSQQIRRLERELRQQLVDRSGRRIRLTPAGEVFLNHAREALGATRAGLDAMHSFDGELSGVVSVGTVPAPPAWLGERLAAFHRGHPAVRAIVVTGHPEQLADAVATESLDLALVGVTGPRQPAGPRGVRLSPLLGSSLVGREPLLALVPPDHPLVGRDQLSVRQLARHELVTLAPGSGLRAVLESVFADADVSPEFVAETDDLHELPALVRAGLGVAVVPASVARANPDLTAMRLSRATLERTTTLLWHRRSRSRSRLTRAFLAENALTDDGHHERTDPDEPDH